MDYAKFAKRLEARANPGPTVDDEDGDEPAPVENPGLALKRALAGDDGDAICEAVRACMTK